MSGKRFRVVTVAAAATLTLAAAISVAAVSLPSGTVAAPASAAAAYLTGVNDHQGAMRATGATDVMSAGERLAQLDRLRFTLARELASKLAAAKAAAVKAAAVKAAAVKAAAAKAAAAEAAEAAAAQAAAQQAAAQQAAAQQAAAQQAATAQPTTTPQATPTVAVQAAPVASGSAQQIAEQMLSQYGWSSSQFSCLEPLWAHESGWSVTAENPSSGAYGIPQAMPGSEMASAGADWQTDAATQIRWGLDYIRGRYGSPCGAWAHEESDGWY
jgi:hypothetical protein